MTVNKEIMAKRHTIPPNPQLYIDAGVKVYMMKRSSI